MGGAPHRRRPLDVVLCWHMHQPQYRRALSGRCQLPWTYLHAIKDYADMVWHLEQVPDARAVVNFTPVLLDQLDDYIAQFTALQFRDPLLIALADPSSVATDDRPVIADALLRANRDRMIRRYSAYERLFEAYQRAHADDEPGALTAAFIGDLAVWYHLAWLGESIRREDARVQRLIEKAEAFDDADRLSLIEVMGGVLAGIMPRYRALASAGRVELTTSPYAHPIVPLLIDFRSALERMPEAPMPKAPDYPGGKARAALHITAAMLDHKQRFGRAPHGCWPSEGSVSTAAAGMLAEAGFRWTASCESVLFPSLAAAGIDAAERARVLYKPYLVGPPERRIACFFRDVHLSDRIGFRYADWHGDDAVGNFVSELEAIADATAGEAFPIVSVILDGENAWEHYPENAYHFLSPLYRAIAGHPALRLTTFTEHLRRRSGVDPLDRLVAGSWVYGTFSTWIGDRDKNRAWDLLVSAKTAFDDAVASGSLRGEQRERAERQLMFCEGSDWFWWFGDYNPAETVSDFDRLFRDHLRDLYALMGVAVPDDVNAVIGIGAGAPVHGGTMRSNEGDDGEGRAAS